VNRLTLIEQFVQAERSRATLDALRPAIRYAKVKLTDNCNSKCVTCDYWKASHENELTLPEFQSILEQLQCLGVEEVMFTGGEPTIRGELVSVVRHAAGLGFPVIALTTNALSLSPRKIDQLLDAGLTQLVLSLEGLASHDELRGVPGNAQKVLVALEHVTGRRAAGAVVAVKLAMTLMQRNLSEVAAMVDLARRHQAVLFFNLIDRGTYFFQGVPVDLLALRDRSLLDQVVDELVAVKRREPGLIGNTVSSLEYARRYFSDPKQSDIPCHLGYIGIDIDANGDVYSNCWGLPPIGNIRTSSLASLVTTREYAERCRAMFRKECPGCSCGYILNLAYHKPSVELDVSCGGDLATSAVGYAGTQS